MGTGADWQKAGGMYGATGRELNYRDPKDQGKEFSLYDMESLLKIKQHIIL